jgi:dihydropteroate synthase
MKPAVARAALAAGASMVNDVAAGMDNQEMWREVSKSGAAYVLMHMQGTPRTMQKAPFYANVTAEVDEFFGARLEMLRHAGIAAEQVVLDVGIGFGKRLEDNLQLLACMDSFTKWGRPLLLGVSRKSFMGSLLDVPVNERLPASLACSCLAMEQGVHIIRTHDVAETRLAVRMAEAILARRN